MTKDDIKLTQDAAADFCKEFISFFFSQPYGSIPKPDLQEFLLYQLDKNTGGKILSRPVVELELFLKMSQGRVQTLKNNIAHKYGAYDFSDEGLLQKLMELPPKSFKFSDGKVTLLIDDAVLRSHLEHVLREEVGISFDYKNNRTMVELDADDFIKFLNLMLAKENSDKYKKLREIIKSGKIAKFKEIVENTAGAVASTALQAGVGVLFA